MKVALIYGYSEGPRIAKKFQAILGSLGHTLVNVDKAQVIIAHSGGSYMVPDKHSAKVVMLVDVPYYDSHWSFINKLFKRVMGEGLSVSALNKLGWNSWYMISQYKRGSQMKKLVINGVFTGVKGKKVLLVRNSQDIFGTLAQDKKEAQRNGWAAEKLPGTHDDIWTNPKAYIKLAEKYL